MFKKILSALLVIGVLVGVGFAQTPRLPPPDALPADATTEQLRAEALVVHETLCGDVHHAAQILTATGTLAQAMPVVVELTGLQVADMQAFEVEVCGGDLSGLSLEELRAKNRQAVWLLDVHLVAMSEVMAGE